MWESCEVAFWNAWLQLIFPTHHSQASPPPSCQTAPHPSGHLGLNSCLGKAAFVCHSLELCVLVLAFGWLILWNRLSPRSPSWPTQPDLFTPSGHLCLCGHRLSVLQLGLALYYPLALQPLATL